MKNQSPKFKKSVGIAALLLAFVLLVGVVYLFYMLFFNARSSIAEHFPENTFVYVEFPENFIESENTSVKEIAAAFSSDIPVLSEVFSSFGVPVEFVFERSGAMHMGAFEVNSETEMVFVLEMVPEDANILLNNVGKDFEKSSDGSRGTVVDPSSDARSFSFFYKEGFLYVSKSFDAIEVVLEPQEGGGFSNNTVYQNVTRRVGQHSGIFFANSQELFTFFKESGSVSADFAFPVLSENTQIGGFFDVFDGGLRVRFSGSEMSQRQNYDYSALLADLPQSTSFAIFGSYDGELINSQIDTGVNISSQFQVLEDQFEAQYGLSFKDDLFADMFNRFVIFSIPDAENNTFGLRYELSEDKKDAHFAALNEKMEQLFSAEDVVEQEFELSDGSKAIELVPKKARLDFGTDAQTLFTVLVKKNDDGSSEVVDSFAYKYENEVVTLVSKLDAARAYMASSGEGSLLDEADFSAISSAHSSGFYIDTREFKSDINLSFARVIALEQKDFVDVLFYFE